MGGSKNKSPAQKEKSQKPDKESKKSKKSEKSGITSKAKLSVIIDEDKAVKYIKESKVITVQDLARYTDVKISIANSFLLKSLKQGTIKRVGGFSGHHVYQLISGK
tara:strand:+ start:40 stop:357 length:318 start_codon:yes stop_codon:yes gene_type:complete